MLRVPSLLNAPPLPERLAPVTVAPAMVRLPPALILKILKEPWLASMVSEEAPGPVMASEPAPDVAAIAGRAADPRVIVLAPLVNNEAAKTMSSLALVALASIIACLSEPAPKSAVVVTVLIDSICLGSSDSSEMCWAGRLERRRRVETPRE